MLTFLPEAVQSALQYVNLNEVYEIRLRANLPVFINYLGEYIYLGAYGLTKTVKNALICDHNDVAECIYRAGNYSVYSIEEELKQGFITAKDGERLGVAGEYVYSNGQPLTIRNVASVCIRIPHTVIGSAIQVYNSCMSDRIHSVLILSPPGYGKTTVLRDLARLISRETRKNILICDERAEIAIGDLGETCDVIRYCDKKTAFEAGIRAMRPDVIVTDELSLQDLSTIERAVSAGVCVLATGHFLNIECVPSPFFNVFERFVVLSNEKIGNIVGVYDKNGKEIEYG